MTRLAPLFTLLALVAMLGIGALVIQILRDFVAPPPGELGFDLAFAQPTVPGPLALPDLTDTLTDPDPQPDIAQPIALTASLPPMPHPPYPLPPLEGRVDKIVVEKSLRLLHVYREGVRLRSYRMALGFAPDGTKDREGDGRTPEGTFRIDRRNDQSAFHLSLGIDYPRPEDRARAAAGGYSPGGDIFFHGQPNSRKGQPTIRQDWTAGCIALSDAQIEELFHAVPMGALVEIRP